MVNLAEYYTPHEKQAHVHAQRQWANVIVLRCARRWGKGRFGFGDLMDVYGQAHKLERPQTLIPPFHAWIVLPTFPQSRQVWNELHGLIPKQWVSEWSEGDQMVWLKGSPKWQNRPGLIEIKSSYDPHALQTVGLDYLWISEAQDVANVAFEKMWPTIRSSKRLGKVLVEGIPSTYPDHFFEKLYGAASRSGSKKRKYFAYTATTFENPLLTDEEKDAIEADKDILSRAAWERYYLAQFSVEAGFFRGVEENISGELWTEPVPGLTYVAGLDIGRAADPTVLFILDSQNRRIVYRQEWDSKFSWPYIRESLVALHDTWGFRAFVFDASSLGGVMAKEDLGQTSLPLVPFAIVGAYRQELLERLAGAIERGTLHYPAIPTLLRQLRAMQQRKMPGGSYRLQVPSGEHDDDIFALALALTACAEPDPIQAEARGRGGSRYYVPTQAEVDGRVGRSHSSVSRVLRERRSDKMKERAIRAGVEVY